MRANVRVSPGARPAARGTGRPSAPTGRAMQPQRADPLVPRGRVEPAGEPVALGGPSAERRRECRSCALVSRLVEQRSAPAGRTASASSVCDDRLRERHADALVAPADPGLAVGRLAEEVEPPVAAGRVTYPGLVRLGEPRAGLVERREDPLRRHAHGVDLEARERGGELRQARGGDGDLEASCSRRLPPRKRSIARAAGDVPRAFTPASRRAASTGSQASQRSESS